MSGFLKNTDIQKLVSLSKERSLSKHRLVPDTKSPILRLQAKEVAQRNEKFFDFIGGAASEVDKAALLPNPSRYCFLISDADGIVIESYAPEGLQTEFQRSGLVAGGAWDERIAGTNGISVSMQSGRVVTVRGKDHFFNCFANFACSSAPLTDAENHLIGAITLVGTAHRSNEEIALCEQALRRASRQFQTRLFRNFHSEKLTARLLSYDPTEQRSFETLIACDAEGVILSHLPLWRDGARPEKHQNLIGQHLSDLRDFKISLRGPAAVSPKRRVIPAPDPHIPKRVDGNSPLGRILSEGGGLPILVDRARKLVAHRVPVLICGEPGLEAEAFARALLDDQGLTSPIGLSFDAAGPEKELEEALKSIQFLSDYPIDNIIPTLILRNIDTLNAKAQHVLERFLDTDTFDRMDEARDHKPVLIFTAGKPWLDLEADDAIPRGLLYLIGQSVLELPPLRLRDRETALDNVMFRDTAALAELSGAAKDVLINYTWPGNIREMRSVIREALICGNGRRINETDLPKRLSLCSDVPERAVTRATLREALDSTNWNVTKAAHILGKSRATINRWIASEGLQRPE
jgi:sigma-54 dependent transcriptional regulator, acetoin dehydrogenase operon transcriptional activator AcoR